MTADPVEASDDALRRILFGAPNEERHTPLTEVLELSAVRAGLKPAFVTSEPVYPEEVLGALSTWAVDSGLLTSRTRGLPSYGGSPEDRMGVDLSAAQLEFLGWRENLEVGEPKGLWIYSRSETSRAIDDALEGRASPAELLAYPRCCTRWHTARFARMEKHQLDHYAARYELKAGREYIDRYDEAKADRDLVRLWKQAEARMEEKLAPQWDASIAAFPFIGFLACPECTRRADSAASEVNRTYRGMAKQVDGAIVEELEAIGRDYERKLDGPCPCGQGKKYRKCCLRQE